MINNIKSSQVDLSWIDKLELKSQELQCRQFTGTKLSVKSLSGSSLSFTDDVEAKKWKERVSFIKSVVNDVIQKCPKDAPLTLISLGSDRLLIEHVISKALLENGFKDLSVFLVDPIYVHSDSGEKKSLEKVMKEFRSGMESLNKDKYDPKQIKFLSSAKNVKKYFQKSNVVAIECFPPHGQVISTINQHFRCEVKPDDLMVGGYLVKPTHANAIAFIPNQVVEIINKSSPIQDTLPLAILQNSITKSNFYLDWGCKILSDWTYRFTFKGADDLFSIMGLDKNRPIKLSNGSTVKIGEWIPTIKKSIEKVLDENIAKLKTEGEMSQEQKSMLLEKVKTTADFLFPGLHSYFLADYKLERDEMVSFLSTNSKSDYRKIFTHIPDHKKIVRIDVEEI